MFIDGPIRRQVLDSLGWSFETSSSAEKPGQLTGRTDLGEECMGKLAEAGTITDRRALINDPLRGEGNVCDFLLFFIFPTA